MSEGVEPLPVRPARRRRITRARPAERHRPLAGTPLDDLVLANLPDRVPPPRPGGIEHVERPLSPGGIDRRLGGIEHVERPLSPKIGLVLGAGGVQGNAYLCGAMAALWEVTGFEPRSASVLVGTSAGSVHAGLYGAGTPALYGLWRMRGGRLPDETVRAGGADNEDEDPGEVTDVRDIFIPARHLPRIGPASTTLLVRAVLRPWAFRPEVAASALLPEGMLTNDAVGRMIRRFVPAGWPAHPRTWIVALNLRTGERTVFGRPGAPRAHLDRAVCASCAIPAFYRPVQIGRDRYIDGGMHSPSNADLVSGLDLDLAVVISPMSALEGHAAAGLIDRYLYPLRRFASRRLTAELALVTEAGTPTLVIQPDSRDLAAFTRNLMDPRPRRLVAETALETTRDWLTTPDAAGAVGLLRHAATGARTA